MKTKRVKKLSSIITTALFTLSLVLPTAVNALEIAVEGNGSESESEVVVQQDSEVQVEQTNEADIENNIQTDSNTGDNTASGNTGGDTVIQTGDSNTNVNVQNSVNSSTVKVDNCCQQDTSAKITNNGSDSQNKIEVNNNSNTNINVENSANVANNIQGTANTGGNTADDNSGNVSIKTGDVKVTGSIKNGPINIHNVKSSTGTSANQNYLISANGSGSTNILQANLASNTNVQIMSYANLQNDVDFDLDTGNNRANDNNGDIEIDTGDAFFDFFIKNGPVNIGGVDIDCCDIFDPGDEDKPKDEKKDDQPKDDDEGDEEKDVADENGDDGELLTEAAADVGGDGIQVIGLSDTTSPAANSLFFWAGLVMIVLGLKFIGEEYLPQTSKN